MRIAVNARFLLPGKMEGFGWYSYETLRRITAAHPEHEFIFLFDRAYDKKFIFSDNITPVVIGPPARHPFLFYWWFEWSVASALKKYKADVFVSPDGYLSLRSHVPSLAVIHDLNFEHYPKDLSFLVRKYYRHYFPRFARKAKRIVTVSEFSKKDIIEKYHIAPDKIDVVYNGINEALTAIPETEIIRYRNSITGGAPYFIFIGALHPRKNLARLFKAFDAFCSSEKGEEHLVIVGEKYFWNKEISNAFSQMKHQDKVHFTGHLPVKDLNCALQAARSMVFVSVFEGFGLPLAESMKCGVPVIAANTSCLPEIGGDAALYCDPFSVESITEAMIRMSTDSELRRTLIERGLEQSKKYSWDASAKGLWNSIEQVLHA